MSTGHTCSQARQMVQAHSSAAVIRSNTESRGDGDRRHRPPPAGTPPGCPMRAMTSPSLSTISRGSSGLPVWLAGHTEVQRPQMVQASVS